MAFTCMIFLGVARFSMKKFQSLLTCAIGRPSCISEMEKKLSLHSGKIATPFNLILVLFAIAIYTVPTYSGCIIYLPIVVKSSAFRQISPMKMIQSFVQCQDLEMSKYQADFVLDIELDSVIISNLSGRNSLGSEFLSLRWTTIFAPQS